MRNNDPDFVLVRSDVPPAPPSTRTGGNERNRTRYRVELEVTLEGSHNFYMGFTENISEGGLFVATHRYKPIGSPIRLTLRLPAAAEPIEVLGEVRWVREANEANNVPPGMGVCFHEISEAGLHSINEYLKISEPLFFDDEER